MWGEQLPDDPANALQWQIRRLRLIVGADAIVTRHPGYLLAVAHEDVDLLQVERAAATTAALTRLGDHAAALEAATAALRSWRGDTLADCRELDFARADAARGDELRQVMTEQVLAARLELGEAAAVVPDAEALTKRHPEREATWRTLMLALYRSGRQEEALAAFAAARRRLDEGAGLEPSPALRALHTAILNHDPLLAPAAVASTAGGRARPLPAPVTPLVGRDAELRRVLDDLRGGARLVTITGLGGVGKTRLALQAGRALADELRDGAAFAPLASLDDASLVAAALADALGVGAGEEHVEAALLREAVRRDGLLVVDNAEHVLGCTPLLAELVATAPELRLLVTSRFSLRLRGEREHRLDPLGFDAADDAAVELFDQRMRAATGEGLEAAQRSDARELCERLDGLPLAIELAAARTRLFSVSDLLRVVPAEALTGEGPDDVARQRTLRATIEWTWQLLPGQEQAAFARLAVFPGSFDTAAAVAVVGGPDALGAITGLFERSLLRRIATADGVRFVLLATLRSYAGDRLAEADAAEHEAARRAHATHYADRLDVALAAGDGTAFAHREAANLRAALGLAMESESRELLARLAPAMRQAWERRSGSVVALLSGAMRLAAAD